MKIYTKRGDSGRTSLFGGQRVSKSEQRIQAYGTVDELNSFLGLAASYELSDHGRQRIKKIQRMLFVLGADLATPSSSQTRIERTSQEDVEFLEEAIDEMEQELDPLKNFILPGGSQAGATLHIARTICRRAEREVVACQQAENSKVSDLSIRFLNRLSDFLFVMARYENKQQDTPEETWKPEQS
ncbi:cob(I)yrinic acid a,c-diamide adenosyltransferase [Fodinibius sediminis]|uniref:Corrinoid adenosyltransferase n=1 Tax=Fodinibius sediminis TaxID=1214077 RepID=A0A521CAF8_9BACT|nr:cob(I)yrinic acid a,c-diamide adenosyltransferase [Fodinibius sediminis]SMO56403.1 cob(I)alamin adenosyltransferase [Fodinibius sediminis]